MFTDLIVRERRRQGCERAWVKPRLPSVDRGKRTRQNPPHTRPRRLICIFCMDFRRHDTCKPRENPYSGGIATFHRFRGELGLDMFRLISQISRFLPQAAGFAPVNGVAHNLMERAEARAGRNPRQAQELRGAALAFLSVVR